MGVNKNPFLRYNVLDEELRKKDYVKTKDIVRILKQRFEITVGQKTISNDLDDMKHCKILGYKAPIEKCNKNKAYYYTNRDYSIKSFRLGENEVEALLFYANAINQYKEYDIFKDFTQAIEKVVAATHLTKITSQESERVFIQTDHTQNTKGTEYLPLLIKAIQKQKQVRLQYQKFSDSEPKEAILEPYLLKEDKHLWYVIGKVAKREEPTTPYALDRIRSLEYTGEVFIPKEYNFEKHFEYSIGLFVDSSQEPIKIVLSFTPNQGKRIKTLPIHHSQKTLNDNKDEFRVSIFVKPCWKLFEKILGYGDTVEVISPQEIKETICDKIDSMITRSKKS